MAELKILVTGANGQLGSEIKEITKSLPEAEFFFTDVAELDITSQSDVNDFVKAQNVNCIINCAAYTAVDKAETDIETAYKVNVTGAQVLAASAKLNNALLVHVSTDYVFNGKNYIPYQENHPTSPDSVYGKSKLEGELKVHQSGCKYIIIRTSWLYSSFGANFVKTILRLAKEREQLNVIFDQVGTPTYAADLANAIIEIAKSYFINNNKIHGVYHYSNEGVCSWYDFATEIVNWAKLNCKVKPIETKDYPTAATRPQYSVLNKNKIKTDYKIEIPHWRKSLDICLTKLEK